MKKFIFLTVMTALIPAAAFAAYVGTGNSVVVPASPGQNVYVAGGSVNISNPVQGDILAAGGAVSITGRVDKDIMVAGGNVNIVGGSAEDVRVIGGNITIGEKTGGEIMAAGGQIIVTPDTVIAKDSYLAGGSLIFSGTEKGNLNLAGGNIDIDGTVNGNLFVKRANTITFGPQSVVKGTIEYSAPAEAVIENGASLASAPVFHKIQNLREEARPKLWGALFGILFILKSIAILAAAYLLWYLRRRDMTTVIHGAYSSFWTTLLRGFAVLVLVPVASIILFITVVGWVPAAVMLAVYVALLVLAAPAAALIAASFLAALMKKNRVDLLWYHILLGLVILHIIALIPFIGWLAYFVIYLLALGSGISVLESKFAG